MCHLNGKDSFRQSPFFLPIFDLNLHMKYYLNTPLKRTMKFASILFLTNIFFTFGLSAKPAYPGVINYTQPDGTNIRIRIEGDENRHSIYSEAGILLEKDSNGFLRPAPNKANFNAIINEEKKFLFSGTPFPSEGEPSALVVLVNFNDLRFSMANPRDFYDRMLNEEGFSDYGATGSARDYFIENSMGKFKPHFDVYGPITLNERASYYGSNDIWGNDLHPELMCIEACTQLDSNVDFTQYDLNGDGYIDNLFIFYAGLGEADTGNTSYIWPHSANIEDFQLDSQYVFDDVILNRYAMSNEMDYTYRRPDGIGTFVHEFSHVMGLPDLYATTYTYAVTPGNYSILDMGTYNNEGRTPPYYSAFERMSLGWLKPELLWQSGEYELLPVNESNCAYMIPTDMEDEFYLFESRKLEKADAFLPAEGMLVWHIDFNQTVWDSNTVNNRPAHQYVDLIEADGAATKYSREGDTFPGTKNVTSFSFNTNPQLKTWSGKDTGYAFSNIAYNNGLVSFNLTNSSSGVKDIISSEQPSYWSLSANLLTNTSSNQGEYLKVYNSSGLLTAQILPGESISLTPGIYVISSSSTASKILIK